MLPSNRQYYHPRRTQQSSTLLSMDMNWEKITVRFPFLNMALRTLSTTASLPEFFDTSLVDISFCKVEHDWVQTSFAKFHNEIAKHKMFSFGFHRSRYPITFKVFQFHPTETPCTKTPELKKEDTKFWSQSFSASIFQFSCFNKIPRVCLSSTT